MAVRLVAEGHRVWCIISPPPGIDISGPAEIVADTTDAAGHTALDRAALSAARSRLPPATVLVYCDLLAPMAVKECLQGILDICQSTTPEYFAGIKETEDCCRVAIGISVSPPSLNCHHWLYSTKKA